MGLTFVVGGREMAAEELLMSAPKRAVRQFSGSQSYHKGFSVEGYPPGAIAAAEKWANEQCREWEALPRSEQSARIRDGFRPPKPKSAPSWPVAPDGSASRLSPRPRANRLSACSKEAA